MILEPMPAAWPWAVLAVLVTATVLSVKVWVDDARRRRQLAALMVRLEALESRLAWGEHDDTDELNPSDDGPVGSGVCSADVLAGKSSHIARLVSRARTADSLADQAVVALYRRLEDPIRPSELAEALSVSLRTLERGLARTLGCTPNQLILTVKMREARRLIASGELRVGEVAHRLSFADAAHLSRRYRRFYRVSPSQHATGAARSPSAT